MRLARYQTNGAPPRIGVLVDDELVDLSGRFGPAVGIEDLLAGGRETRQAIAAILSGAAERVPREQVRLCAPIARPPKFLAIGLNYPKHNAEAASAGMERPEMMVAFNKQSTCVTGPYDPIEKPGASDQLDYEGELAFVIGRRCRRVPADRAHEVIAGYLVVNDVTARDFQMASPTMTLGKSWDTHGPSGPWITTADAVEDPHDLSIKTWVNGELRQDSSTRHLVTDCFEQVAQLSQVFTLEPGDIVATGTPAGVGFAMKPPTMLQIGDTVRVEVQGLGHIENRVIEESVGPEIAGDQPPAILAEPDRSVAVAQ